MGLWSFVGRAEEFDRLSAAATGGGRGLILSGSAGIGKSRLLREVVDRLPTETYAVWSASGSVSAAGLPFAGLAQVLPAEQPPGLSPSALLRWAVESLRQRAAGRPIVLAIDDAHLLDPTSAAVTNLIARSGQATVLGTLRSGEPVPLPIRALWADDLVEHDELAPLSFQDTTGLLTELLGGPLDPASAERLWRLSGGNPLLLRELIIAAQSGHELTQTYGVWRWTGRLELAPSLTDLIDTRIGQLSPQIRAIVELVAFGQPIGLRLLLKASQHADVEAAEERGLIRVDVDDRRHDVSMAHPLYSEVVRRRCPVTRSQRLQAQLASLVETTGSRRREDLLRVAVWRLESDTADDPTVLLTAAAQAFAGYDIPLADRLATRALTAGGGFDAAELMATILMFRDEPEQALTTLESVRAEVTTQDRRSRWLMVLGLVAYWGLGRESTVDELADGAGELSDPADRARVNSFEAIMRLHRLECDAALRLARAVLDRPAASHAAHGLAQCTIAHLQAAQGDLTGSGRAIARVEADATRWRTELPYLQLAMELARGTRLVLAGDLAGIDAIVAEEFADLADAGDFRLGSGYLSVIRAQAARLRGRLDDAMRHSLQACAMLATGRVFAGLAHAERAHAAALRGEPAEAAAAMTDSDRAQAPGMSILYPWREQARCWVTVAEGDLPGAVDMLRQLAARLRTDGFAGHELAVLHDLVRLGRADLAVDRLAELSDLVEGPLPALILRQARGTTTGPYGELLRAANGFAELGLHLFAAEAAAMAVHRLRVARSSLVGQTNLLLGELLARCADVRTPALLAGQPNLTDREHQVAQLAAAGVASRDIADQLFLSIRTVENHLQRAYGKLGVTGRTELAGALRALPDAVSVTVPGQPGPGRLGGRTVAG
ncbi:LuxR C-terminal-related transcriptional regulator [Micromonospora sp. NBC_01813]|uniref:LuxR C-terminal-related transcriptional regulator n=1 Tax=Micromonospora sp. NBC_01813 TaxID=2975988 RepID=UPI002DD8A830|nr:LuxR C-terminal-related transcriptional regulator [Micromonospora sp. NBC_01813]WSA12129.1 LuxR C-terminal-related transcriptional regulator [Micromonospora sp. NBC_01813]